MSDQFDKRMQIVGTGADRHGLLPDGSLTPRPHDPVSLPSVDVLLAQAAVHLPAEDGATEEHMQAVAEREGYTIDAFECCRIQGVLIRFSRPTRKGETLLGLPLAGPRMESEVIERHYSPDDADDDRMAITIARACQQVVWAMEHHD